MRERSWLLVMLILPVLLLAWPRVWPADADPKQEPMSERPMSAPIISPGRLVVDRIERSTDSPSNESASNGSDADGPVVELLQQQAVTGEVTARTIGNFIACFDDDVPAAIRTVFEQSLGVWDRELLLSGPAIEIDVYWTSFNSPGALAASGPSRFVQDSALPDPLARYPAALANEIVGIDYSPRATCDHGADGEGVVYLNSTAGGDGSLWHLPSTSPPPAKIDLESVVTHELAHALGFVSSASVDDAGIQRWPFDFGAPYIYDTFFRRCAVDISCSPQTSEALEISSLTSLTDNDLWFQLPQSELVQLYAPEQWDPGSSISHVDEERYDRASGFSLLSPYMGRGEEHDGIDNITLSFMQTLGWPIARLPATPKNVQVASGSGTVRMDFESEPLGVAPAAIDYEVTLFRQGFEEQVVTIPGSPVVLAGLENGANYQFTVRARTAGGLSAPTPRTALVTPLEFPPFATAESFADISYQQFLGRPPTSTERAALADSTRAAEGNLGSILNELADNREVLEQRQIVRLYLGFFNRQPDIGGLDFWINRSRQGESLERIALQFAKATEFEQGEAVSDQAFVTATYNRVLDRAPDAGGLAFWVGELGNGLDRGRLLLLFSESPEHVETAGANSELTVLYRAILGRPPTVAELRTWTSIVDNLGRLPLIEELVASEEYEAVVVTAGR